MGTFCPQLWDGCYIDRAGDVFACCHLRPMSFGNIYDGELRDIVNSDAALEARAASLRGTLACHSSCNLFDKSKEGPRGQEHFSIDYARLERLHISFGEACNIRCVMCDHPKRHAENPVLLDPSIVIRNVDVAPFKTIMIQGGEPLYLRECLEFMSYLERLGKKYTLLTNGVLIDDLMATRLAKHARAVNISINGATKRGHELVNRGSRFERVVQNVQRLRKAREALGTELVLTGHMTINTSNVAEVPLFLRTFRGIGFDRVNFGYVKETVPRYLAENPDVSTRIRNETISAMTENGGRGIDHLRLEMLGLGPSAVSPNEAGISSSCSPPLLSIAGSTPHQSALHDTPASSSLYMRRLATNR